MLANMAISLIQYKRITTTLAKAKALRKYMEPLVTKSKDNTTHSRRIVFGYLQNKEAIQELFSTIAGKIGERPGGYLRVIKLGFRRGDGAETAMIEFVDFNEVYNPNAGKEQTKKKTRRGGARKPGTTETTAPVAPAVVAAPAVEEAVVHTAPEAVAHVEEAVAHAEPAVEEAVAHVEHEVAEATPAAEEAAPEAETEKKDDEAA
jgi:large subunit ribosomal protein L17